MPIHVTAVVDAKAEVDSTADIGPYCVVGPNVRIGPETQLVSHVHVANHSHLGARNKIFPFASIGGAPQDLKYKGEPSRLVIGDDNIVRESATLNIGTEGGNMETRIGNGCLLMAYSHVAHDCLVGDHVVMSNSAGLAGHVAVGDYAILAGMAGVHQFCRIGRQSFIAGGAMVGLDVPPFCIAQGDRAQLVGINVVGLKRAGWKYENIQALREGFRQLFLAESTRMVALEKAERDLSPKLDAIAEMCGFIRQSTRGVCTARSALPSTDPYEG